MSGRGALLSTEFKYLSSKDTEVKLNRRIIRDKSFTRERQVFCFCLLTRQLHFHVDDFNLGAKCYYNRQQKYDLWALQCHFQDFQGSKINSMIFKSLENENQDLSKTVQTLTCIAFIFCTGDAFIRGHLLQNTCCKESEGILREDH